MLTPTKSRSHRSPGRTGFVIVLTLAVVLTVAGVGYLLTRQHGHPRPAAAATTASLATTPPPTTTSAPPTTPSAAEPSQLAPGVVPFVALPVGTPPTPGASEARYPWHVLKATLHGPTTVSAGSSLSYTVTLRNPTAAAIALTPCPSYDVDIGLRTSSYGLNCAAAASPTIAPGASTTFEVRVYVPASIGVGHTTLTWKLGWLPDGGSPHAQLRLEVQ